MRFTMTIALLTLLLGVNCIEGDAVERNAVERNAVERDAVTVETGSKTIVVVPNQNRK